MMPNIQYAVQYLVEIGTSSVNVYSVDAVVQIYTNLRPWKKRQMSSCKVQCYSSFSAAVILLLP